MRLDIKDLAHPGFLPDVQGLQLPAEGWTDSRNVRYRDGAVEKFAGYDQALGNLSATAIWADTITDGANSYWLYGNETVLYATDGTNHANISHPSLTYNASFDLGWTGGAFHGMMVVNDGINIPQQWIPALGNKFSSLSAWPTITCQVIRPHKDFLFALRITDTGIYNPRLIRWSDAAPMGAMPGSWDYTDPSNQAGIVELGQSPDLVIDAVPLRDSLIIYKEFHTWIADYVGGADIFGFRQVFSEVGMLTENCAAPFKSSHIVWTADDLVMHDGNSAQSIIDKRTRRWLFSRINTARYRRCFVASNYRQREFWFCFPEEGQDWPTLALAWNWSEDTMYPLELGNPMATGVVGIIPGGSTTFDTDNIQTTTFDTVAGSFDEQTYLVFSQAMMLTDAKQKKAYRTESGETFNGATMLAYAQRQGTVLSEDLGSVKRVWKVWPRINGTLGDTINFYVGTRNAVGDSTLWSGPYVFTIGVDSWFDCRLDARMIDIRFEYTGSQTFRFFGVAFDYERTGAR